MDEAEFDVFADEYRRLHARNISASGEPPEFFHAYKVADIAGLLGQACARASLSILDFGCGVGNSLPHLRRHFPHAAITGLDVSGRSLSVARQRFPDIATFVRFSGRGGLPFESESFDLVLAACVFHHIPVGEHRDIFHEWRRILKPGGTAVVFEHNPYNPLTVRAVNTCAFDRNAVLIKAHHLATVLEQSGLVEVRRCYRIFFPHAVRHLRPVESLLGWLPLGAQYRVSARRE